MLAEVFTQKVNVYCGFYFQDLIKRMTLYQRSQRGLGLLVIVEYCITYVKKNLANSNTC